jgi:hypothetical protein
MSRKEHKSDNPMPTREDESFRIPTTQQLPFGTAELQASFDVAIHFLCGLGFIRNMLYEYKWHQPEGAGAVCVFLVDYLANSKWYWERTSGVQKELIRVRQQPVKYPGGMELTASLALFRSAALLTTILEETAHGRFATALVKLIPKEAPFDRHRIIDAIYRVLERPAWANDPSAEDHPWHEHYGSLRGLASFAEDALRAEPGELRTLLFSFYSAFNGHQLKAEAEFEHSRAALIHHPNMPHKRVSILFLAANPTNSERLRLDAEARQIEECIRTAKHGPYITLITGWAVRPSDLTKLLLRHQPDVVHFSGHGTSTDKIVLESDRGIGKAVSKAALTNMFSALRDNVRLVVLNACYSSGQAAAIAKVIDCTIGSSKSIDDAAAIAFAAEFYQAIAFGRSVQSAFDIAKASMRVRGLPMKSFTLMSKAGVDPSSVFFITEPLK